MQRTSSITGLYVCLASFLVVGGYIATVETFLAESYDGVLTSASAMLYGGYLWLMFAYPRVADKQWRAMMAKKEAGQPGLA